MPHDLPEGWAESLADDEVGFLYEEARQQLRETSQFGALQEAKTYALLSVSLILISASSILGALPVEATPAGIASVAALVCSLAAVGLAFRLLRVRQWVMGMDIDLLARWAVGAPVGERAMKEAALEEVLVPGVRDHLATIRARSSQLPWLLRIVVSEAAFVALAQVFRAVGWSG